MTNVMKASLLQKTEYETDGLKWWDWLMFVAAAVVCGLLFQQADILHTAGSSFALLNGHFRDFYAYNANGGLNDSYMISTYIIFALWNIPMKILGFGAEPTRGFPFWVRMWFKLCPSLFFIGSAVLVFLIARNIGMGEKKARCCSYVFLTTPIAFFSQFIFGQYDSFTVFFVLLGYYFYLKEQRIQFVLSFSVAFTLKYFSAVYFFPLLLLREKDIWKIIRDTALVLVLFIVETAIFRSDPAYGSVTGFGAKTYIFAASIYTGFTHISITVVVFGVICGWAYFTKLEQKDKVSLAQWSIFLLGLAAFDLFGLSMWHPQWLIFAMPILVLGTFIHKDTRTFLTVDILMMLFMMMFTINFWTEHVDQELLRLGILGGNVSDTLSIHLTMRKLLIYRDKDILFTMFSMTLLVSTLFKHPKYLETDFSKPISQEKWMIRTRFVAGVGMFVIPALICYFAAVGAPVRTFDTFKSSKLIGEAYQGTVIEQPFTPRYGDVRQIDIMFSTFDRVNGDTIDVRIVDAETKETLFTSAIDTASLSDYQEYKMPIDGLMLKSGKKYYIEFESEAGKPQNAVSFFKSEEKKAEKGEGAIINGVEQDFPIAIRVYEQK